jgi:alkylation response protein AidB-like acyl-CoA dehydrogenase
MTTATRGWLPTQAARGGQAGWDDRAAEFRLRVRDVLNEFTAAEVSSWDQAGHLPRTTVAGLARHGIFRARWEPGAEGGLSLLVALSQEACQLNSGLALAVMGHSEMFIGSLTWLAASASQLALLEDALDGRAIGCFAATEAHGGSDLAGIRSTADPVPGGWRLRGCKRYVSNVGGASHVLLLARPQMSSNPGDLGLFLLPLDHPGVTIDGFFGVVGIPACDVGQVSFDAEVPSDALLGKPGLGLLYATHLLHFERISICAQLLSSAELTLRLAVGYARQRTVGGARVFDRQAIRHRLASCQAELWNLQGRLAELTMRTVSQGRLPAREIAAFKLTAGEASGRIVDTCMQVFGARGVMHGYPMERIWRDIRLDRLGGGTDEVLADLVASGLDRADPGIEDLLDGYMTGDTPDPAQVGYQAGQ